MVNKRPVISIVTVMLNDAWAATKTFRSIHTQELQDRFDVEVIVVDGCSQDASLSIAEFWKSLDMIDVLISEEDEGVYDAMMKGVGLATGEYICFMNAGDQFYDSESLQTVLHYIRLNPACDAVLGWGRLGDRIQGAWLPHTAFAMASLGFCHQALYMRRKFLIETSFNTSSFKTDSDVLQIARAMSKGLSVDLLPKLLANRATDQGISADLKRTKASVVDSITSFWPDLSALAAGNLTDFRRSGAKISSIITLLETVEDSTAEAMIIVILDTLGLEQGGRVSDDERAKLLRCVEGEIQKRELGSLGGVFEKNILLTSLRVDAEKQLLATRENLKEQNKRFGQEIGEFIKKNRVSRRQKKDFTVQLTSFPERISGVPHVIYSLLNQSVAPSGIALVLGRDEFPRKDWLPAQLLALENEGMLKIFMVKKTCHQYDKFIHRNFDTSKPLVIVDDDVIYLPQTLEQLWRCWLENPDCVIANRANEIKVEDGKIQPYALWRREVQESEASHRVMATGAGGVLYPPEFFDDPRVTSQKHILRCAPYADDVWLKKMALEQGRKIRITPMISGFGWYHRYTPQMEAGALHESNIGAGLNDTQIKQVRLIDDHRSALEGLHEEATLE